MDSHNFIESSFDKEKYLGITFRALENKDIPELMELAAKQYAYHNKALTFFNYTIEDTQNLMDSTNFEKSISQGMSFGAFRNDKLISFSVACDKAIDTNNPIELRENVQNVHNALIIGLSEENHDYVLGQCFDMHYLVTDNAEEGKGFGSICFHMSCKAGKEKGFKKYFVYAFHPGTKRITEKYFKETSIVGTKTFDDNLTTVWSITAKF